MVTDVCGLKGQIPSEGKRRNASTKKGDQGRTFRLETRTGEFIAVASLKVETCKLRETKSAQPDSSGEALGLKGPGVTAITLETGRSSPGQGEARRKSGGGP